MSENTKRISRLSLLTALSVGLLYLAAVLPTAHLTILAVCGFLCAVAVMMYSTLWAAAVYVVTAALALLILPDKLCAIYYAAFFGYYPILKSYLEKIRNIKISWLAKFAVYCLIYLVWFFAAKGLFFGEAITFPWYILFPLGAVAFVIYDICMSILIRYYIEKISGYIK